MTTHQTSEGLILIFTDIYYKNKLSSNIEKNKDNTQAIVQLKLAENDFRLRTLMKLHFRWNLQHCYVMKSLLSKFQGLDHQFIKLNDIDGNELILYSSKGMIYIPHCIIINTIDPLTDPIHCYNNIPISFQYQNISKLAFLQSSRNISDIDNEIACENKRQKYNFKH